MRRFMRWLYSDFDDEQLTFVTGYWTGAAAVVIALLVIFVTVAKP